MLMCCKYAKKKKRHKKNFIIVVNFFFFLIRRFIHLGTAQCTMQNVHTANLNRYLKILMVTLNLA